MRRAAIYRPHAAELMDRLRCHAQCARWLRGDRWRLPSSGLPSPQGTSCALERGGDGRVDLGGRRRAVGSSSAMQQPTAGRPRAPCPREHGLPRLTLSARCECHAGGHAARCEQVESTPGRLWCAREGSPPPPPALGGVECENGAHARACASRGSMPLTSQSNSPGDACAIHVHLA